VETFRCETCELDLNSTVQYESHMAGIKHKEKLQQLEMKKNFRGRGGGFEGFGPPMFPMGGGFPPPMFGGMPPPPFMMEEPWFGGGGGGGGGPMHRPPFAMRGMRPHHHPYMTPPHRGRGRGRGRGGRN